MKVAETSIKYSILINLLVVAIVILGISSMLRMPREEFPAVEFGRCWWYGLSGSFAGDRAVDHQQGRNELSDLPNRTIRATPRRRSTVSVSFDTSVDPEEAYDLVSREVNKITDLPADAIDPIIIRLSMRELNPIAQIVVSGDFTPLALREVAEDLKNGLLKVDNISKVELVGARDRQIWVDVDQARIDAYGISLNDISSVLQGRNLNIPGGTARYGKTEFLVRTLGQFESMDEVGRMIVQSDASGRAIRISDVATVRDTLAREQTKAKLNGKEGISIFLYKKGDGNIIKVMEDVRAYIAKFEKNVPRADISVRNDGSIDVKNGIGALSSSALQGIILVFLTLLVFLGWRNALFASTGIPIAMLITFIVIPLLILPSTTSPSLG